MIQSEQDKMISASSVVGGLFKDCKRDFVRICPKCGEEIYHTYNNLQGAKKIDFYTQCDCKSDEYLQEAIAEVKNNFDRIVAYNKEHCGFKKHDIEDVNSVFMTHKGNIDAYNAIITYGDQFDRETKVGFYLYGPTGVGKSLLAKKAMAKVLAKGFSAFIINAPTLTKAIISEMNDFKNDTLDQCVSVDLLVIDDFGSERCTEFQIENMFLILEARWRDNKPIIFTSNLTLDEISEKYKDKNRIYSRLCGNSRIVKVDGKDMRVSG